MSTETAAPNTEIALGDGGQIALRTIGEQVRFAGYVLKSGMCPAHFKTAEAVLVAMQAGAELGLKPLAALNAICVVNGRPCLYGAAVAAVVLRSGKLEWVKEWFEGAGDDLRAFVQAKRRDVSEPLTKSFGLADAKRAGLLDRNAVWKTYPADMLCHKARKRCYYSLFADVLGGVDYAEDLEDLRAAPSAKAPPTTPDPALKDVTGSVAAVGPEVTALPHLEDLSLPPSAARELEAGA